MLAVASIGCDTGTVTGRIVESVAYNGFETKTLGPNGQRRESVVIVEIFQGLDATFAEPDIDCGGEKRRGVGEGGGAKMKYLLVSDQH